MGNLAHDTCILQNGLSQLVQQATRGSACIDPILTTYSQLVSGVAITVRGGRTRRAGRDYSSIEFSLLFTAIPATSSYQSFTDFRNADYLSFI